MNITAAKKYLKSKMYVMSVKYDYVNEGVLDKITTNKLTVTLSNGQVIGIGRVNGFSILRRTDGLPFD